jgi:hypothetical protein
MAGAAASGPIGLLVAVLVSGTACASRAPARPSGSASGSVEAAASFTSATTHCAGLRTVTFELGLSGRAGRERVRGRVIAGLAEGGHARLEGLGPFGPPVFILAARAEQAVLWLPRERRVLADTAVAAVVERLTGLPLGADDLLAALTGCVGAGGPTEGRAWPGGWQGVATPGGRTVLLRRTAGAWRVVAVDAGAWRADYRDALNGFPRRVRLRSDDGLVDIEARIQQLEANVDIDAAAFRLDVPADADALSLDELRSVAPLREP